MSRRLVVSAVNFTEGGPLTVLREFVDAACSVLSSDWEIIVFAHDRHLLSATRPRVIEIPYAKRSWARRLWVEWYEFGRHARALQPHLWVSLHDISPNVGRTPQAVYCHNPAPFFRPRLRDAFFEPTGLLFALGYGWLYRINIKRNRSVVVQQSWLRDEFRKWTKGRTEIIVAHPSAALAVDGGPTCRKCNGAATFLYPALPRPFKNIELVCRAVEELEKIDSWHSEVILTVEGNENRYARWLKKRFGTLRTVRFMGRQSREQMQHWYARAHCLVFPSRMETWGLPITEAQQHRLPMFVADVPYARETVGNYAAVDFVDVNDYRDLGEKLLAFQQGRFVFSPALTQQPTQPFVSDWAGLVRRLIATAA